MEIADFFLSGKVGVNFTFVIIVKKYPEYPLVGYIDNPNPIKFKGTYKDNP